MGKCCIHLIHGPPGHRIGQEFLSPPNFAHFLAWFLFCTWKLPSQTFGWPQNDIFSYCYQHFPNSLFLFSGPTRKLKLPPNFILKIRIFGDVFVICKNRPSNALKNIVKITVFFKAWEKKKRKKFFFFLKTFYWWF